MADETPKHIAMVKGEARVFTTERSTEIIPIMASEKSTAVLSSGIMTGQMG